MENTWVYVVPVQNKAADALSRLTLEEHARRKHRIIEANSKRVLLVTQYLTHKVIGDEVGLKVEAAYIQRETVPSLYAQQQYVLTLIPTFERDILDTRIREEFAPEPVDSILYDWSPK